jgi:hypothetical protein
VTSFMITCSAVHGLRGCHVVYISCTNRSAGGGSSAAHQRAPLVAERGVTEVDSHFLAALGVKRLLVVTPVLPARQECQVLRASPEVRLFTRRHGCRLSGCAGLSLEPTRQREACSTADNWKLVQR